MASQPTCPPCSDSPLSITSNIIAIITFIYVLLVGLFYRGALLRGADNDIRMMVQEISIRHVSFKHWEKQSSGQISDESLAVTLKVELELKALKKKLRELGHPIEEDQHEVQTMPERKSYSHYWRGWKFVHDRDELREMLGRFDALLGMAKVLAESGE